MLSYAAQGWSAVACQDIAEGSFVAQYAGEVISNKEAESRLEAYDAHMQAIGHALLVPVTAASSYAVQISPLKLFCW